MFKFLGDEISITVVKSKVVKIVPHAFQTVAGFVTQWDGNNGLISKDGSNFASFGLPECKLFYMPSVGDGVCAQVIQNKSTSEFFF